MELPWIYLQLLKAILAIAVGISFPKCVLPLKKGIKEENQKLVNKGMIYLMIGVFGTGLFIYCMAVG